MSVKRGLFLSFIGDASIAGIVGAGGNIAAAAIGAGFQAAQNRKDRQWQEHMQKAQWQAQEYFMDKQNKMNQENYLKYQSPAALRAQNEAAGINSFAPDGSSIQPGSMPGVDQGSSGSVPGGNQPSPGAAIQPAFAQAANTILDAQFKQAQIDKANAEAERIRAETIAQNNQNSLFPLVQAGMENDNLSKKYQAALAEFNAANAQYRLELEAGKITAETQLALDRSKEALAKAAKTDSDRAWNDSINQSIVDLNKAKAGEAGANAGLAAAKTKTEDQLRDSRVRLSKAQATNWLMENRHKIVKIGLDVDEFNRRLLDVVEVGSIASLVDWALSGMYNRITGDTRHSAATKEVLQSLVDEFAVDAE